VIGKGDKRTQAERGLLSNLAASSVFHDIKGLTGCQAAEPRVRRLGESSR